MQTNRELIDQHFPNANWDIPPLSNPTWADAIASAILHGRDGSALPMKTVAGYPMLEYTYNELTAATRRELPTEEPKVVNSPAIAGMTRFVHANYDVDAKQFYGILVVDSVLIATGEHKPTIALAKRELQGYLALLNGGHKTLEGIKQSIAEKESAKRAELEL